MFFYSKWARLLSGIGILCLAGTTVSADVRITTQSVMNFSQVNDARLNAAQKLAQSQTRRSTTTVTAIKGMWERIEMTKMLALPAMDTGRGSTVPAQMEQTAVKIIRWDTNEEYLLFAESKVYARLVPGESLDPVQHGPAQHHITVNDPSKIKMQVRELANETLQNVSARRYQVVVTDMASPQRETFSWELWLAPATVTDPYPQRASGVNPVMALVASPLLLRQQLVSRKGTQLMFDLKEYTDAPLEAALFAPPADYKEISLAEFEKIIARAAAKIDQERLPPQLRPSLSSMETNLQYQRGLERLLDELQRHP